MLVWQELPLPPGAEEVAYAVRRAALRVHRSVGAGFREHVYQRCLAHALRGAGHSVDEHVTLAVRFDGMTIPQAGEADLIVDRCVVVELKARPDMHPAYRAQVLGYLRATGHPLGLLLNFHASRPLTEGYDRIVHPDFLRLVDDGTGPRVLGSRGPPAKRDKERGSSALGVLRGP